MIRRILLYTFFFAFFQTHANAQLVGNVEQQLKESWTNFRPRDASVFYFKICVPEEYLGYEKDRAKQGNQGNRTKINLSRYAKYTCFKLLEQELSKKANKKIIVADPTNVKNNLGLTPSNSCGGGFTIFPGWTKKSFLDYDDSVQYIISVNVDIISVDRTIYNIDYDYIEPICKIQIKIYDRESKVMNSYKYTKKYYQKTRNNWLKNDVFNDLFNTDWSKEYIDGLPVVNIVGFYYQTLMEMMDETDFHL